MIDNESFFKINVVAGEFDENDLKAMQDIDSAELLDKATGLLKTHYELTDIKSVGFWIVTGLSKIINSARSPVCGYC